MQMIYELDESKIFYQEDEWKSVQGYNDDNHP